MNIDFSQITTIFFDVDGIFTDGSLYFSEDGVGITKFNVHDGLGCILLEEIGIKILILSARQSESIMSRFKNLGIKNIYTNILKKKEFVENYSKLNNLDKKEIAMMGDDIQDLATVDEIGYFFTTPNAIDVVKDRADYITKRFGGDGAVREICDLIISSKGSCSRLVFERYIKNK